MYKSGCIIDIGKYDGFRVVRGTDVMGESLKYEFHKMLDRGIIHFISGMERGAELLAAELILELKRKNERISLEGVLPYEEQAARWSKGDRERYFAVMANADAETLIQHRYTSDCYRKRDQYMIDKSDYVIFVSFGESGAQSPALQYSRENAKEYVMLSL